MSNTTTTTTAHTLPKTDRPCPDWCELESGHGWESCTYDKHTAGDALLSRFHVRYVTPKDGLTVSVTCEESADRQDAAGELTAGGSRAH